MRTSCRNEGAALLCMFAWMLVWYVFLTVCNHYQNAVITLLKRILEKFRTIHKKLKERLKMQKVSPSLNFVCHIPGMSDPLVVAILTSTNICSNREDLSAVWEEGVTETV